MTNFEITFKETANGAEIFAPYNLEWFIRNKVPSVKTNEGEFLANKDEVRKIFKFGPRSISKAKQIFYHLISSNAAEKAKERHEKKVAEQKATYEEAIKIVSPERIISMAKLMEESTQRINGKTYKHFEHAKSEMLEIEAMLISSDIECNIVRRCVGATMSNRNAVGFEFWCGEISYKKV